MEIGSGWGPLACYIATNIPDTTVHTITLSVQQMAYAENRFREAGVADRVHVHLCDYRKMPAEWEGTFDRVVSVEMVEAVGKEYLQVRPFDPSFATSPLMIIRILDILGAN